MSPALPNPFHLFAFGTLMTDGPLHSALAGARLIGPARTQDCVRMLDLGAYPGLVHAAEGGRSVVGELFEVPLELVEHLDEVEGAPTLFRLEPVLLHDHVQPVFAYFYQGKRTGPAYLGERWNNTRQTGRSEGGS